MADRMFPGKFQSDFAVQVTSQIPDAQQFTINFTNNNLLGSGNFISAYKTSKARICVTVGMMTTGYDCPDVLNLGLFRPIFSPTDFIQIKGRGTRKHDFREQLFDEAIRESVKEPKKTAFKLFDFFGICPNISRKNTITTKSSNFHRSKAQGKALEAEKALFPRGAPTNTSGKTFSPQSRRKPSASME